MITTLFLSEKHKKLWETLDEFIKKEKSFLLVIEGEEGTGKTTITKHFLEKIRYNYDYIYFSDCNISTEEFLKELVANLTVSSKSQNLKADELIKTLDDLINKNDRKIVITCDNVTKPNGDILDILILLTQKHKNKLKLIFITNKKLKFKSSFPINYERFKLERLSFEDTVLYILYISKQIKKKHQIVLDEKVYKKIYKLTKGNIKKINDILDSIIKNQENKSQIIITKADLKNFSKNKTVKVFSYILLSSIVLSFIAGYFLYMNNSNITKKQPEVEKNTFEEKNFNIVVNKQETKKVKVKTKKEKKANMKEAIINLPVLVFKEKNFNGEKIFSLNKSDKVYILKRDKDWIYILFKDKDKEIKGWIPQYAIQGEL